MVTGLECWRFMDASSLPGKIDVISRFADRDRKGVAMPFDAPLRLGPFTVDRAGRLAPAQPDNFPSFSVVWHGRTLSLRLAQAPDGTTPGILSLHAILGRVPSTADSSAMPRDDAFAALRAVPPRLPAGWQMALLADHRVALSARAALAFPTTAVELIAAVSLLLLELTPYLDLLDTVGIAGAGGVETCAGKVNTCPG
jgi:hypothetical protein